MSGGVSEANERRTCAEQSRLEGVLCEIFERRFPFHELVGLRVDSLDPAAPRLAFTMRPELVGSPQHKRLHGGVIATALDTIGGLAVILALADRHAAESVEEICGRFARIGTIDLRVDFLHQGVGDRFAAGATVVRLGSRIAATQMSLTNDASRLIATGAAAYVID